MSTFRYQNAEVWFVTGSQHLYGEDTLKQVESNSKAIVKGLNEAGNLPIEIIFKPIKFGHLAERGELCHRLFVG